MGKLKGILTCYEKNAFYHKYEDGQLGPAENITLRVLNKFFKLSKSDKKNSFMKFRGIIPENVLHFDIFDNSIMFYTRPQYRELFFERHLGIPTSKYRIPFLLWIYKGRNLKVFALKSKPKIDSELYQAPFMNISDSGSVCMGNVKYGNEENYFDDLMQDITDKFFNSLFTHTNTDRLLKMNYLTYLKEYANKQGYNFSELLVETKYKLKDFL